VLEWRVLSAEQQKQKDKELRAGF